MSLSRFMKDRRGGVAPMFAIAVVPLLGLVGAAVDYSRANSIRAGLQSALDATALAMAKLAPTLTQSELQTEDHRLLQRDVQSSRGEEHRHHADLHDGGRLAAHHRGRRLDGYDLHAGDGLQQPQHRQHRRR